MNTEFLAVLKSKLLNEFFWIHKSGGAVFFGSRINYTKSELEIIKGSKPEIVKTIHEIKKMFSNKKMARVIK